jgi:hypothetical protein
MKHFAVKSTDKTLLKAFEEKLKQKGIAGDSEILKHHNHIIIYETPSYMFCSYHGLLTEIVFTLPAQWDEAVSFLEDNTKPEFKVNDWVIWEGMYPTIGQIKEKISSHSNSYILKNIANKELGYSTCHKDYLRHATKEEIYNHLISQTDLKVGDEVVDQDGVKGKVGEISLYSKRLGHSFVSMKYFREHGDHLVVAFNDCALPISHVQKVNSVSFIIKTDKNEYIPQIENGKVSVGCVKGVSKTNLRRIRKVNEFCQEKEINLLFKPNGKIQVLINGEVGYIEYDQINELIQKMEENEQ